MGPAAGDLFDTAMPSTAANQVASIPRRLNRSFSVTVRRPVSLAGCGGGGRFFARDVHESVAMRATNQLASIDRKLRTLRRGVALRGKPWRIPAMLNERYRLFGVWRSRIVRGDRCRLRDALGHDKAGGKP